MLLEQDSPIRVCSNNTYTYDLSNVCPQVVPQCGEGPGGADEADVAEYCKTYLAYKVSTGSKYRQSVQAVSTYAVYSPTASRTIKAGSKKRGDLRLHRPGSAVRKVASNGMIEVDRWID